MNSEYAIEHLRSLDWSTKQNRFRAFLDCTTDPEEQTRGDTPVCARASDEKLVRSLF